MKCGISLCSHTMSHGENDEIFFLSINLMNAGGPFQVYEPSQRSIIAQFNLEAGQRSIGTFCDYNRAFKYFKTGVDFLCTDPDHFQSQYQLSIELFDALVEVCPAMLFDLSFCPHKN